MFKNMTFCGCLSPRQMESSVWQFDAELVLLRHQKLLLDWQLKLADLRELTLYQELLLLKEFERREDSMQENLSARTKEEISITVGNSLNHVEYLLMCSPLAICLE